MVLTAAEVRAGGDATAEQRAELKGLLETKQYPKEWRDKLFGDIADAGGLSVARAKSVLNWLREQPDLDGKPVHAGADQVDRIQVLMADRIAPGPWAKLIRDRVAAGTLMRDEADRYLSELQRLPKRVYAAPTGPRPGAPGSDAPDGYFAVAGVDGAARCYRIHTVGHGQRIVDKFTGDKPSQRRRLRGWQAGEILRAVAGDTAAAAKLFAVTRKRCSDCNQPLHNEDQPGWPYGVGPDCWAKRLAAAAAGDTDNEETDSAEA